MNENKKYVFGFVGARFVVIFRRRQNFVVIASLGRDTRGRVTVWSGRKLNRCHDQCLRQPCKEICNARPRYPLTERKIGVGFLKLPTTFHLRRDDDPRPNDRSSDRSGRWCLRCGCRVQTTRPFGSGYSFINTVPKPRRSLTVVM